jgi:hypothetical protein
MTIDRWLRSATAIIATAACLTVLAMLLWGS